MQQGGVNALSLAFFAPGPMGAQTSCDFGDLDTPCLRPASGAGSSEGLKWALETINTSAPGLSKNTAPIAGAVPTVFFSFGGMSEGGGAWDNIFGSDSKAALFGKNAAALVMAASAATGGRARIGIDLDIEGTATTLPSIGAFVAAFRADAAFNEYPLMMCTLSGIADPSSSDHFKLTIMESHGPAKGGINYLNLMVDNQAATCERMSAFWRDERLSAVVPLSAQLLGMWGINNAGWILKDPGCTDGDDPLFPWMKSNSVGFGIWQWWMGDPSPVASVISKVRAVPSAAAHVVV